MRRGFWTWSVFLLGSLTTEVVRADISGVVLADGTSLPIEGARVVVQATTGPSVVTNAAGLFTLPVNPSGTVKIAAAVAYDPEESLHFLVGAVSATNGQTNVEIRLREIPVATDPDYQPLKAATPAGCGDCHAGQLAEWLGSNHAMAAQDTWVRDLFSGDGTPGGSAGYVFTDFHPGETGNCATCHAPNAEARAPGSVAYDQITGTSPLEGVNCSACHQLDRVDSDPRQLHLMGATAYRFPAGTVGEPTRDYVWGPLGDVDYAFMRPAHAPIFEQSLFCASCHEYDNQETGAPGQHTYTEWANSAYAVPGDGFRSCQNCHMPTFDSAGPVATPNIGSAPNRPASQRHHHDFVGATPTSLTAALPFGATVTTAEGRVVVQASVTNSGAGHAFPTGVSIRNAFLLIEASLDGIPLQQTSGSLLPYWTSDDVAGRQTGDYDGLPGFGFAKILRGTVGGQLTEPVLFVDAETVAADTTLPAGHQHLSTYTFDLPTHAGLGDALEVRARLLYRRAFRALAVTKGWTETPQGGPIEIEVASALHQETLTQSDLALFADGFESANTSRWSTSIGH